MQKYYTRACNFYYNKISREKVKKKISLPVGGNKSFHLILLKSLPELIKKKSILEVLKIFLQR